ncbi:MAG TPA: globin family protein [Alphaproteobacteria bacterium]|nr:globin family protein [Alphaproteobacteria bacterium]
MTPEQNDLLRETWRTVAPIADDAAKLFYDRLFEIDPGTRPLFARPSMPEQRAKLVEAIRLAIDGLDELDRIAPTIEALGRRHAGYNAADAHYFSVGAALLWTLEQGLGASWTPDAADAWSTAYTLIADTMRRAAAESLAT